MKAQLKNLIHKAWELEKKASDGQWPKEEYSDFQNELQQFPAAEVSRWARHMTPTMTLRHFQTLIVPLERELQKNPSDEDFLITHQDRPFTQKKTWPLHIALDHWRSAFNVGSLFRTADGLGIEKLHLWGYTPTPENKAVQKTSLDSHLSVPWASSEKTSTALLELKKQGYHLVAFETSARSVSLEEKFPQQKTVMIFGNERFGMNSEDLKLCDEVRQIPMHGIKNSLNVSVCAALAIYEWKKQWTKT